MGGVTSGVYPAVFALYGLFNPYTPSVPPGIEKSIVAAAFGEQAEDTRLAQWLERNPDAPKSIRQGISHRLCTDHQAHGDYADAATACANSTALGADDEQSASLNLLLNKTPPIRAVGSAHIKLTQNGLGSRSAAIQVNGVTAQWIMDTGAQITVVSASLARKIGVRLLGDQAKIGSTTDDVQGGVGVIDRLQIGEATVENIPVMILPDSNLKIGDLPQIQAICGLPVFAAFHRVAWLDGGDTLVMGSEAPHPSRDASHFYWHEQGLGIPISTSKGIMGAHFDTGEDHTILHAPAHILLSQSIEQTGSHDTSVVGGVGGLRKVVTERYKEVKLNIAGASTIFHNIKIDDTSKADGARVGYDFVSQTKILILDFDTMKISAH